LLAAGESLLQAKSERTIKEGSSVEAHEVESLQKELVEVRKRCEADMATLRGEVSQLQAKLDATAAQEAGRLQERAALKRASRRAATAREILPQPLMELGMQVFGDEARLNTVVAEAAQISITYGDVPIQLRILRGDNAEQRLGQATEDGQEYGLDSLLALRQKKDDMVNMVDMGGNYGVVAISVYNKFRDRVRAVIVEPIAVTYFFMRWNMWINDVPYLTSEELLANKTKPGVLALNAAVTQKDGEDLQMCSSPGWSMNARPTDQTGFGCDCNTMTCTSVPGITTEMILDNYFQKDDITLLKMDCEGCEFHSLPSLAKNPQRVRRLVGELHLPAENLIDIACAHDAGKYMSKVCKLGEANYSCCLPLDCENPARQPCNW
jgi:FkbM family methyltransferase